jgi:pyrroline-5-carboxylate reductase
MPPASSSNRVAILGAGNLGSAIAKGLVRSGLRKPADVYLTHLEPEALADFAALGHPVGRDNAAAAEAADVLIVAVRPQDVAVVIGSVKPVLDPSRHVVVSTATGVGLGTLRAQVGAGIPIIRAMPNLGIQTLSSMTCLALGPESEGALPGVEEIFGGLGETIRIDEANMNGATALCASGTAFFLRAIRAASQGGVEVGFHGDEAIRMAAQTAKGAAELILAKHSHPETEIDRVATPNGCTIAGLNEMESLGFSSAFAKGVVAAAKRAAALYSPGLEGG